MREDSARAHDVEGVVAQLQAEGLDAVWVDRAPVFDRDTLLHALYQALHMPAWFGFNWDALEEMLYGSDDGDAAPRVLVFRDLELLEQRDPTTARTFLDIVDSVAADPASSLQGIVRARRG